LLHQRVQLHFPILIAQSVNAAVIDKFEVKAATALDPETKLIFFLQGTPKSDLNLTLPIAQGKNVVHMKKQSQGSTQRLTPSARLTNSCELQEIPT
jgi:hypothetical protein